MMKILRSFLLMALMLVGVMVTQVEAATVAVIPLINKVAFQTVEEERVPNMIFTQQAIAVLKSKPGFMLVENPRLKHAIETNVKPYELPNKEQMAAICKKGNVDIIFGMELLSYDFKSFGNQLDTRMIKMDVRANLVSYNRLTGQYTIKKCIDDSEMDETFTSRWDVAQESWTRMVHQEMDRITRTKRK